MEILVVDQRPHIQDLLRNGLANDGARAHATASARDAEQLALSKSYDVILIDRSMADLDARDFCRKLRSRGVVAPILMLARPSDAHDSVSCLDAGADYFVVDAIPNEELVALIRAAARRAATPSTPSFHYAGLDLDGRSQTVRRDGRTIELSNREFRLLEHLLRNAERVVTRQELAGAVWKRAEMPNSNVIDVYVSMLRRKIDSNGSPALIHTVIGQGYRIAAGSTPPGAS